MTGFRWRRRLALGLARLARRLLPDSRQPWNDAMREELAHVADD